MPGTPREVLIQAHCHQVHHVNDPQAVAKAPARELRVTQRNQKPRPGEFFGSADQGLEVVIGLGNRVREECDAGGVSRDSPMALDHPCGALADGVAKAATSVVAVDARTQRIARGDIRIGCGTNVVTGDRQF
jgi:hypothetical protein